MTRFPQEFDESLTVLMAAKNAESTLKAAIRSCLRNMPEPGSLFLFLDDCSDSSREIAESFNDPRIVIFSDPTVTGAAACRNYLLARARTNYLAIVDSDDVVLPYHFRRGLAKLKKGQCDFVFSNAVIFSKNDRKFWAVPQPPFALNPTEAASWLTEANPFVHSSAIFRRNAIEALGGYDTSTPSEDYTLWLRAAHAGYKLSRSWSFGVAYRRHEKQLSQNKTWKLDLADSDEISKLQAQLRASLSQKLKVEPDDLGIMFSLRTNLLAKIFHSGWFGNVVKQIGRLVRS